MLTADFIRIAQERADGPLAHRLESNDVLAIGQHHAADPNLVISRIFRDYRERAVAGLAIGA
ncbi:hypothetical protein ACVWXN_003199 [Bradyrhizobium sp. i1.4.4]